MVFCYRGTSVPQLRVQHTTVRTSRMRTTTTVVLVWCCAGTATRWYTQHAIFSQSILEVIIILLCPLVARAHPGNSKWPHYRCLWEVSLHSGWWSVLGGVWVAPIEESLLAPIIYKYHYYFWYHTIRVDYAVHVLLPVFVQYDTNIVLVPWMPYYY